MSNLGPNLHEEVVEAQEISQASDLGDVSDLQIPVANKKSFIIRHEKRTHIGV